MFDLSPFKLLILAVIALIVFGPHELPKITRQAGRMLRDLRRIAEGATADLREGLGPEFQNLEFEDLNPRRFVQKHLLDDMTEATRPLFDEFRAVSGTGLGGTGATGITGATGTPGLNGTAGPSAIVGANGTAAVANGTRPTLLDGQEPPFDLEAT
ncbi:MAG TPA: sec-independent translocase [Trebonia sp.]|nr:sec-independent translocase [Trebonia sp.]